MSQKSILVRKAWRELDAHIWSASPAGWMSDEDLERLVKDNVPRKISVKQIRQEVNLANAAPAMLQAARELLEALEITKAELSVPNEVKKLNAAIEKATSL